MVDIDYQTQAGIPPNEDHVWTGKGAAVELDGTSGLTDRQFTDADSDGRWYVDAFVAELKREIHTDASLTEIVATAIDRIKERLAALIDDAEPATYELPAAAGIVLRWGRETLEYFVLGDCTLLVATQHGIRAVVGEGPRQLDQHAVEQMIVLREQNEELDYQALRERVDPLLIKHRKQQNQPGGYWMLGCDTEAVEHAKTGRITVISLRYGVIQQRSLDSLKYFCRQHMRDGSK